MGPAKMGLSRSRRASSSDAIGPSVYLSPNAGWLGQNLPTVFAQVAGPDGKFNRHLPLTSYDDNDRIGMLQWKDWIVFTKDDEVLHMTRSPCGKSSICRLNAFVATHEDTATTPPVYVQR